MKAAELVEKADGVLMAKHVVITQSTESRVGINITRIHVVQNSVGPGSGDGTAPSELIGSLHHDSVTIAWTFSSKNGLIGEVTIPHPGNCCSERTTHPGYTEARTYPKTKC